MAGLIVAIPRKVKHISVSGGAETAGGGGGKTGLSGLQAGCEGKSEEILLGHNLGSPGSSLSLQRPPRGHGVAELQDSVRREKIKSNPEKWHFSTLPR